MSRTILSPINPPEGWLVLPFLLRAGYVAQLVVPRDMTRGEADRLCQYVQSLAIGEPLPSFRCPRCGAQSFNPKDVAAGYCGACHDFTG